MDLKSFTRENKEVRSHSSSQGDSFLPPYLQDPSPSYSSNNSPHFLWGEKKLALPPLSFISGSSSSSSSPPPLPPSSSSYSHLQSSFPTQYSSVSHYQPYSVPSSSTSSSASSDSIKRNRSLGTIQLLPRLVSALDSIHLYDNAHQIIVQHAPHLVKLEDDSKRVSYDFVKADIKIQHTLEKILSDLLSHHNPYDSALSDPSLYTGIVLPWMLDAQPESQQPNRSPLYSRSHYPHFAPHFHHPSISEHRGISSPSYQSPFYPPPSYSNFNDEYESNNRRMGIPPLRMHPMDERGGYPSYRNYPEQPQKSPPLSNGHNSTSNHYAPTSNNKRSRTTHSSSDLDHLVGAAKKEGIEEDSSDVRHLLNLKNTKRDHFDESKEDSDSEYTSFQSNSKGEWDCDRCNESFLEKEDLVKHYKVHNSAEKPYTCKECGRGFRHTGSLKDHLFIHSGLKPYKCDLDGCNKSFSQASNLRRHKRIHTGEKPYVCPHCDKAFNQSSNMKQHILGHAAGRY
eukprot:TRINITY_DN2880_c0_g1_i4.p1 TRINITY_DN2880_c0_g1~~TRINITY_DN2880_c0_g1_i4.p1  ORF type:complete len:510 (-),score=132.64 TRINITY_DN2880_c0_g1_i4:171-1700(-)